MGTKSSRNGRPANGRLTLVEPATLESAAWARHDGGKGKGPPRCYSGPCDDEELRKPRRRLSAHLRPFLLEFVGGCKNSLKLLLRRSSGRVTDADLARIMGVHRANAKRRIERFLQAQKVEWITRIAEVGRDLLRRSGGATIDPMTARAVPPADGWLVSMKGFEIRCGGIAPISVIAKYAEEQQTTLFLEENVYLALFLDTQTLETCINLTRIYDDLATALAVAAAAGQVAITHARTLETRWLTSDEWRRAA